MKNLFQNDPLRFQHFSTSFSSSSPKVDILLDYSKNLITSETKSLLLELAREASVAEWRDKMFRGEKINVTEDRAVLHVALRNRSNKAIEVDGKDVMPEVRSVLAQMKQCSDALR